MNDIRALLTSTDEEVLAASGALNHRFPESVAGSVTGPSGNEA